jgi:hypothetical protein
MAVPCVKAAVPLSTRLPPFDGAARAVHPNDREGWQADWQVLGWRP